MTAGDFIRINTFNMNEDNLIKFAKHYVEEALKAAAIRAVLFGMKCESIEEFNKIFIKAGPMEEFSLYKDILNSYSLENIK